MKSNRRTFIKTTIAGAAAVGAGGFLAHSDWLFGTVYPGDTKKVFARCGACSHTFLCLLNREFGHPDKTNELASDPLAGGLMNTQNQCGMLWGASLAAGLEAFRRCDNSEQATLNAIVASQEIVSSFKARANTLNCRNILNVNISEPTGVATIMLSNLPGGFENSVCMNLAERWAPEAIKAAKDGLEVDCHTDSPQVLSCASEVLKQMGGSEEEMVTVAGFAGGIGLSAEGCGALGAAIWKSSLDWCRDNPGESGYLNPKSNDILEAFMQITKSEFKCHKICNKSFASIEEHSEYINRGGCETLLSALATA